MIVYSTILLALIVAAKDEQTNSSEVQNGNWLTNATTISTTTLGASTTSHVEGSTHSREFNNSYIWATVVLITILVVVFIWFAYEMTQDCIKDEEEEQDRSLYLPLYSEEEEEEDIIIGDTIYGSNVQNDENGTRSELSKIEPSPGVTDPPEPAAQNREQETRSKIPETIDKKNWPDLKVTNKSGN